MAQHWAGRVDGVRTCKEFLETILKDTEITLIDKKELRGQLADVVEDFLAAEDDVVLKGSDYDIIADGLENVLIEWGLI